LTEYSFLEGVEAKVAVANGLKNADFSMTQISAGKRPRQTLFDYKKISYGSALSRR